MKKAIIRKSSVNIFIRAVNYDILFIEFKGSRKAKWCKSYGMPWHSGDYKIVKPKGEKTMPIPVEQWTTDGCLVATFTSLTDAEQKTGISHIREASDTNNTSRKTAGGYIWKRLN